MSNRDFQREARERRFQRDALQGERLVAHDPRLTRSERMAVTKTGRDPDDYIALPVEVALNGGECALAAGKDAEGRPMTAVLVPLYVAIPATHVYVSRVMTSAGTPRNPLEGMLPVMSSRLVLPRARLQPYVLEDLAQRQAAIDAEEDGFDNDFPEGAIREAARGRDEYAHLHEAVMAHDAAVSAVRAEAPQPDLDTIRNRVIRAAQALAYARGRP